MVLYHAVSTYHILESFVHKYLYHREEKSVLILPDFVINKFPHVNDLVILGLFDEVVLFPYRQLPHEEETLKYKVNEAVSKVLHYNIQDFSCIYVFAAHFYFTEYLIRKEIHFNYFEDGCGILCRPDISYDLVNSHTPFQAEWAKSEGLFDGSNKLIDFVFCNVSAQTEKIDRDNIIDFDVAKCLGELDPEFKNKIFTFFKVPLNIEFNNRSLIVMTQQLANLKRITDQQQLELYRLNLDYYAPKYDLIFKPHPDDVLNYESYFPDAKIIRGIFPSELLPSIVGEKLQAGFVLYSSSLLSIESCLKTKIFCGYGIEEQYLKLHRYYISLQIIDQILVKQFYKIYSVGFFLPQLDNLIQYCNTDFKHSLSYTIIDDMKKWQVIQSQQENNIYLIDSADELRNYSQESIMEMCGNSSAQDVFLFLNFDNKFLFYDIRYPELSNYILPIIIRKYESNTRKYSQEVMFLYTKNDEIRRRVSNMDIQKDLKYSKMTIHVQPLTESDLKIALLEGQLQAAEERLKYYIEKEKENQI